MYCIVLIGIVPDPISDLSCNWSLDQMNLDMADLLNNIHSIQIIVPTKTVPSKKYLLRKRKLTVSLNK
jgi:hypothetical protein